MSRPSSSLFAVCLVTVIVTIAPFRVPEASTLAAEPQAADAADRHPELRRLSKSDDVWLDVAGKRLVVGGSVAMAEGVIEVFACPKQSKEHEA
ncbi:MAG: hypothetical protein FJ284_10150, partial [Planctomycetes bacterium]|nr:hypothetical protein [Planctomycetota bacterium]